ncbi:general secretion pathway protein GspL [Nitrosospira lacus]|uniref:General secretion pathway protein GspL n=2 Tax=Nitrosospira lacus TaxID=1288494 RepID=A0A1W6SP46_9PROT|nr:general secretion pathway protein GspL [Nitrosospira lacus]
MAHHHLAQILMSLLKIHCRLPDESLQCDWVCIDEDRGPITGAGPLEGQLADLLQCASHGRVRRVQLIIPAAQVLLTRVRLPPAAKRRANAILAFAIEEEMLREPDASQVSWVGSTGDDDVLAVVDRKQLQYWLDALGAAGMRVDEMHCETLLLPWIAGEWSLAWDGREGFVRTSEFEGAATDCGNRASPPLSLQLMLEEAEARGAKPISIALYTVAPAGESAGEPMLTPDTAAWQKELGVSIRFGGGWDWRKGLTDASVNLLREHKRGRVFSGLMSRLRPAAWIAGGALALHAIALAADWTLLASEQRVLRQQMESRFRAIFPDAVAVVDPALQMRRKLAETRHAAGVPDSGDFLPMIEMVAMGLKESAPGSLRTVTYENERMTLELAAMDEAAVRRIAARLRETGLSVDVSPAPAEAGTGVVVIHLRAS